MNIVHAAAGAGALALALTLSGCASPARPHLDPDVAGKPTWGGCQERSMQITDYVAGASGYKTRTAALEPYRVAGDRAVERPARAHRNAQVLLVGDGGVIHHAVGLTHTGNGWLVSTVEACAD